jgi:hypothetical protein
MEWNAVVLLCCRAGIMLFRANHAEFFTCALSRADNSPANNETGLLLWVHLSSEWPGKYYPIRDKILFFLILADFRFANFPTRISQQQRID